jgi:hypothetical protein
LTFSGTLYFPIGGGGLSSATETNVDIDSPAAVTIQNLTVQLSTAPGVGNSIAFTWRKNASSQTLTCTISGASATSCSDTTHSFTTASLDLLDIQVVTTGTVVGTPTVVMAAQVGVAAPATGVTSVSQNSGAAETNLPITGFMPQICADSSGSGTAQSCTVANTFVPQTGNCVVYSTTTANSGTGLTVNVNSLGAKSVAVPGASGFTTTLVASSSIPAGKPIHLCYDGTNWNASGTGYVPAGGVSEIIPGTNVTCATNTGGYCVGNVTVNSTAVSGPNFVQYTYVTEQPSTAIASITSPSITPSVNDLVVVMCRGGTATPTVTTSSPSETWNALAAANEGSFYSYESWAIIGTAGAHTFTCTPATNQGYMSMNVVEFSGTGTTLQTSASNGTASSVSSFTSSAISLSSKALVIFCAEITANDGSIMPGLIYGQYAALRSTTTSNLPGTGDSGCESLVVPAGITGTLNASESYTGSAQPWVGTIAAFNY